LRTALQADEIMSPFLLLQFLPRQCGGVSHGKGFLKKISSMMIGQDLCFIILTLAIHTRNRNHEPQTS
jgi:hypothetical protein